MSRSKKKPFEAWLTAYQNLTEEVRFIRPGNSLFCNIKYNSLTPGAQMLYLRAAMESAGKIEFTFPATAMKKHGISVSSGRRYIDELIEKQFITLKSSGQSVRKPNIYCFNLEWKNK